MFYLRLILISAVLTLYSTKLYAGLFGPSNYDECVLDGVKDSKAPDSAVFIRNSCRSKFPKLSKLSKNKNVELFCEEGKDSINVEIKENEVFLTTLIDSQKIIIDFRDKDYISFSGNITNKKKITYDVSGKIESSTGRLTLYMDSLRFVLLCKER